MSARAVAPRQERPRIAPGGAARSRRATGGSAPAPLYPQLLARRNASREQVSAHQRARLHGAMVEAVAAHGYTAATVNEVTSLAGVSKKTLYKHFDSRQECFLATYDLVVERAVERISAAYREKIGGAVGGGGAQGERDWLAGLCRSFDAFVEDVVARPKPARLALVEVLAAGSVALARIERGEAIFARMIEQGLAQAPDGVALPPILLKGVVHGIWYVAHGRLLEGRPAAMSGCGRELLEWLLCYRSPAARLLDQAAVEAAPRRHGCERAATIDGDERTRMLRAAAQIAAAGGYETLTSGQVAELAGVEWEAFSREFDSVEQCFLASLELLSAQALARALRDAQGASDWPAAACRAVGCLLREVAEDPVFARVAFVEVFAAGPAGVRCRAALMRSFAALLERRAPRSRRPSPLVAEAIAGAVWGIVHHHVAHGSARTLPALADHAAYITLAPILGAEQAVAAILAERTAGARRNAA
jgi:AcrR family transcriptional regulator